MIDKSNRSSARIRLSHVSRSFIEGEKRHIVLNDVSAEFAEGQSIAIRGRSGSGKSTLLNLISGIDAPDSGRVVVVDRELNDLSERERTLFRRRHIGFIYQAFNLVPTLTVADNLRLVLELNRVPEREASARIEKLLMAVGLPDRANSYPDVLSGGEQQRVAIARAMSHRPSILLADEPTGNLDDQTAQSVLTLLDGLLRKSGGTMIVATHSDSVTAYCDQVMELHNGILSPQREQLDT